MQTAKSRFYMNGCKKRGKGGGGEQYMYMNRSTFKTINEWVRFFQRPGIRMG